MGNDLSCGCGGNTLDYTPEEYKAQLALYQAARGDSTITENL